MVSGRLLLHYFEVAGWFLWCFQHFNKLFGYVDQSVLWVMEIVAFCTILFVDRNLQRSQNQLIHPIKPKSKESLK